MPEDHPLLSAGIVDDFHDQKPVLVIVGDAEGFLWLANLIESGWSGDLSTFSDELHLAGVQLFTAHSGVRGGLERCGAQLRWRLSSAASQVFPKQLRALAQTERDGHAYLDDPAAEDTSVHVVASRGEYDPGLLFGDSKTGKPADGA